MTTSSPAIGTFPWELAAHLRQRFDLRIFVETGTAHGITTWNCAPDFERLHTVELDLRSYLHAKRKLAPRENVRCYYGKSPNVLPLILPQIDAPAMFWLDAHWSGGGTIRMDIECPLLDELRVIGGLRGSDVVLIDDARLFTNPPPAPHKAEEWPTLAEIMQVLNQWPNAHTTLIDDVIVVAPGEVRWPL